MIVRAIVQARMGSTRLPGKSLMKILEEPLLYWVLLNISKFEFIDDLIVATTDIVDDDPIEKLCDSLNVRCFRGHPLNVLDRFYNASLDLADSSHVVRFTADNPMYNQKISKVVFENHISKDIDYTYVDGLSHVVPEFFKVSALRKAYHYASTIFDKEHVTPYFRNNKDLFKIQAFSNDFMGLNAEYTKMLTIDTLADFERIQLLHVENNIFNISLTEIYDLLKTQ